MNEVFVFLECVQALDSALLFQFMDSVSACEAKINKINFQYPEKGLSIQGKEILVFTIIYKIVSEIPVSHMFKILRRNSKHAGLILL